MSDEWDDEGDFAEDMDDDAGEECGRWINGKLGKSCTMAGTEFCDWDCPYRNRDFLKKP